ncbi:MAG: intradiol ring-cleavage dioxygenase [Myxococcota bacterium]
MDDVHDGGLQADLAVLWARFGRRRVLKGMAMFSAACATPGLGGLTGDTGGGGACARIPEETEGPYPGDGTNGPDALALDGIVRSDLTGSIGSGVGTAAGVPLTLRLRIVDASGCTPLAGAAVYVWHCDQDGNYSMYTAAAATYLRGVQVTDADGYVEFTTIFPGCYSGRWPHVHFEVYPDLDAIDDARNKIATSQVALPEATCDEVYATSGYEASVANLARTSLSSDMVFSDSWPAELAGIAGTVTDGLVASLSVPVSA